MPTGTWRKIGQVLRIFDVDPRKKWPQTTSNIVLGPGQFLRMPFVGDDKTRTTHL